MSSTPAAAAYRPSPGEPSPASRFGVPVLLFAVATLLEFLGMSDAPSVYDEGIALTAAMRILAGQMPHRDFYANSGPAHFYLLAAVFRLFGQTLLAERTLFAVIAGLIVTAVFLVCSRFCSRPVTWATTVTIGLWLFGIDAVGSAAIYPVSLLNLIAAALLVSAFLRPIPWRRAFVAGALGALSTLFRYDTGVALLAVEIAVVALAVFLRPGPVVHWLRRTFRELWPLLLGFSVVIVPTFLFYISRAPLHPFVEDIIIFPAKYYPRARGLPFPGIHPRTLDNVAVYTPILIALLALAVGLLRSLRQRAPDPRRSPLEASPARQTSPLQYGFLIVFGLLGAAMYVKGLVRASVPQMYLALLPGLLALAMLFDLRASFRRPLRLAVEGLMVVSVLCAAFSATREAWQFHKNNLFILPIMHAARQGTLPPAQQQWCRTPGPLTGTVCFLTDPDRMRAIDFIRNHTAPGQTLFIGVPHHDRIFGNDNLTYFAAQRLPATHWSHFDPLLQNRLDIQQQMVGELDSGKPPLLLLDSVFEAVHEPNASDLSTGVIVLDTYIHTHYHPIQTFGQITLWQRNP